MTGLRRIITIPFSLNTTGKLLVLAAIVLLLTFSKGQSQRTDSTTPSRSTVNENLKAEYLWLEAENMRGFATQPTGEPVLNASWQNPSKDRAPGWGINGPGVSAEWSQGGESEWNSAAASADETKARIYQDLEIPRAGKYKVWVRYADWANKSETFSVKITLSGQEVFRQAFGEKDVIDPHDEVSLYWGWAFAWNAAEVDLQKGRAQISIEVENAAGARRHVDAVLLTNDLSFIPEGRRKPDFAAARYLRQWSIARPPLASLIKSNPSAAVPAAWSRPKVAGRDFMMPWNISTEFWKLYDKPAADRPLFPFNAEPVDEFVKKYKGQRDVPIFSSSLVVPVIYINHLPEYLKEGSAFRRYLGESKQPFAVLINYGSVSMSEAEGKAAWALLNGELKEQFLGWMSGESVGYVWEQAATELKTTPSMSRRQLLEAHHTFYTKAIAQKWAKIFHTETGAMWDKLIPAQSTSSTSFSHALADWGVKLLGMETPTVQPIFGMRIAFTRGAARQFGGSFLYYHAPNFGDTATTFTKQQNFAGPDNFFHSRYGATMGPSLSWYRKSYYLYYMAGASAIYLEQGFDQFFKPGPGNHEFQLNPLGRITEEFMKFAEKHPDRGTPYTPVAFLLDPAHGWDMTDYPQWPFGVSQINRSDRALRELFGIAYFPGLVVEGEPATGDRQAFVNGAFGDTFDVVVASRTENSATRAATTSARSEMRGVKRTSPLDGYRAVVVGGHVDFTSEWIAGLRDYVKAGGTVVVNSAQIKNLPSDFIGVRLTGQSAEDDTAYCVAPGETRQDLAGQMFRYDKVELIGAEVLIKSASGAVLVTVNRIGKGAVIFSALPDLLGEDERITPFAAHMLAHVFADVLPVRVRGDVEYLINRSDTGWIVTLFNNNGVFKPQQGMATVDRNAKEKVTISLSSSKIATAIDWVDDRTVEVKRVNGEDAVAVEIAPGGVSIIHLSSPK